MLWGGEYVGLYQVPEVVVSGSYPVVGGLRHQQGSGEGGNLTRINFLA